MSLVELVLKETKRETNNTVIEPINNTYTEFVQDCLTSWTWHILCFSLKKLTCCNSEPLLKVISTVIKPCVCKIIPILSLILLSKHFWYNV